MASRSSDGGGVVGGSRGWSVDEPFISVAVGVASKAQSIFFRLFTGKLEVKLAPPP